MLETALSQLIFGFLFGIGFSLGTMVLAGIIMVILTLLGVVPKSKGF
jgi:hypothetical protein